MVGDVPGRGRDRPAPGARKRRGVGRRCDTKRVLLSGRSRLALFALIGIFLIPVITSSVDGLTHVLTCQANTRTPFVVSLTPEGPPTISSAETIVRSQAEHRLCGGLSLDMAVTQIRTGTVRIILPIKNGTRYTWRGSVRLTVGRTSVPVGIGEVRPGATRTGHVDLHVESGTHSIGGSLLIGP